MKVAINARVLSTKGLRGWSRYTINLAARLPEQGVEVFLYSDQPLHEPHAIRLKAAGCHLRVAPPMKYLRWEQWWQPRQCEQDRVDVLHCPINFGLPWSRPCPRVLTLHDAIDVAYYRPLSSLRDRLKFDSVKSMLYHWTARNCADHFVTVSQHARRDLIRLFAIPGDRIAVIYGAADDHFHDEVPKAMRVQIRKKHLLSRQYIFYVGGWERRKNIPFLVRAFAEADIPNADLVLAGGEQEQQERIAGLGVSLNISNRLRLLPWVDDADLPALYAEALCFVYPSEYEGFGLQLCEAMAAGCPTFAACRTSLPEVLGRGGDTFDTGSTGPLARLFGHVAGDADFRAARVERARRRGKEFCWSRTAKATVDAYSHAIHGCPG